MCQRGFNAEHTNLSVLVIRSSDGCLLFLPPVAAVGPTRFKLPTLEPTLLFGQTNLILVSNPSEPESIKTVIFHRSGRGKLVSHTFSRTV